MPEPTQPAPKINTHAPSTPLVHENRRRSAPLFWVPLLWSAVAERSGDTAFDFTEALGNSDSVQITRHQSGVAPSHLPPQSISN